MSGGKEDKAKFYIDIKQKGKAWVRIGFQYASERKAFLEALNQKCVPWKLQIDLWESGD